MHATRRPRTAPLRGVTLLLVVTAAALACVVLGLLVPLTHGAVVAADALALLGTGGAGVVLHRHARRGCGGRGSERDLWTWLARAVTVVAGAALVRLALDAGTVLAGASGSAGTTADVAATVWGAAALAAAPLVYRGVVRWNLSRGPVAEPGDWLNGLSAVFVVVAGVMLVLTWSDDPLLDQADAAVHGSLFRIAACAVLAGTVGTVASLGGLGRDVRPWVVGTTLTVVGGTETAALLAGPGPAAVRWDLAGWVLLATVLAWCTRRAPAAVAPRPASAQAPTLAALGVMVVGVGILVADGERLARVGRAGFDHHLTVDDVAVPLFAVVAVLGVAARVVHLVRDLAHLARSRHEARTDDLTGIANRRALMAHLDEVVGRTPVALLVLDLDRFKDVNDRFGHAAGDALLRAAAAALAPLAPPDGLLARLGGDEFAVVVPGDEGDATATAARLAGALATVTHVEGRRLQVTASVGLAAGEPGVAGGELLRRADVAMYRAKSTGAGVCRYDEGLDRSARERSVRLEELRATLDPAHPDRRHRFVVHYQPQVCVTSGDVCGVEALVRWDHPVHGLLGPDRFLDLVERDGLMAELTDHVLRTAAHQAVRWGADGHRWRVAVNLSTSVLTHPHLLPLLDDVLAATGLDPVRLVLEVTETTLMADADRGLAAARAVTERGVALSIDDYGTGHSSLAYLNDLPVAELKLDRSFVARLCTDERTAAIVAATVELAHRLGLRLVAEGVEDAPTLAVLRSLGCDESQGYLHARPQPADLLTSWARRSAAVPAARTRLTSLASPALP